MNSTAGIPIKLLYEAESMKITVEVSYDLRLLYVNNSLLQNKLNMRAATFFHCIIWFKWMVLLAQN